MRGSLNLKRPSGQLARNQRFSQLYPSGGEQEGDRKLLPGSGKWLRHRDDKHATCDGVTVDLCGAFPQAVSSHHFHSQPVPLSCPAFLLRGGVYFIKPFIEMYILTYTYVEIMGSSSQSSKSPM